MLRLLKREGQISKTISKIDRVRLVGHQSDKTEEKKIDTTSNVRVVNLKWAKNRSKTPEGENSVQ